MSRDVVSAAWVLPTRPLREPRLRGSAPGSPPRFSRSKDSGLQAPRASHPFGDLLPALTSLLPFLSSTLLRARCITSHLQESRAAPRGETGLRAFILLDYMPGPLDRTLLTPSMQPRGLLHCPSYVVHTHASPASSPPWPLGSPSLG